MTNRYSATWFETFLRDFSPVQTEREIAFLARHLPQPAYRRVLDLCCGLGRHAIPLAARGYQVTGLDRSAEALAEARRRDNAGVAWVEGDMRDLAPLPGPFDAVLNLWQSFGYFDATTNRAVLRQIHDALRPGGRFILDIYHRAFFAAHQGDRARVDQGRTIVERKTLAGDRLTVRLDYGPDVPPDVFEWQVYMPDEIGALAADIGFRPLVVCREFDESRPPDPAVPRMQFVFERG
jgi:SAM-dependent methyltransferase